MADHLIIGIGINLKHHPEGTPYPATDLANATGISVTPETALEQLIAEFDVFYRIWVDEGFGAIRQKWLAAAYRLGETIEVQQSDSRIKGIMNDLDVTGALRIQVEGGKEVIVHAGDVYFPVED